MTRPLAFSPAVLAALAKSAETCGQRNAEIVSGVTPKWHVIRVFPGADRKVAAKLIARRFGIFIPESDKTVIRRGRKIDLINLMFPGYIFVFVWDVLRHRSIIESVPGVVGLIYANGKPATISDEDIDVIRKVENHQRPLPMVSSSSKRRRRRKGRGQSREEIVSVQPWSPFARDLIELDSAGRNQSLMRALGLCS